MPEIPSSLRIAVLIDCDNVSPSYAPLILEELASHGTPTIKRAYGDWTTTNLNGWKKALNHHAIQPVQQFAYTVGKNSTDSTLIIDAMDLLWMGNVDAFALVSSDSDFTRLATRLRESGKRVIGLGQRKTPASLRNAVDQFVYLELLKASAEEHDDAAAGHDADAEESAGEDEAQPGQGSSRSSRGGRGRRRGGRGSKSAGAETPADDTHAEESTTDAQPASTPELAEAESRRRPRRPRASTSSPPWSRRSTRPAATTAGPRSASSASTSPAPTRTSTRAISGIASSRTWSWSSRTCRPAPRAARSRRRSRRAAAVARRAEPTPGRVRPGLRGSRPPLDPCPDPP